MPFTKNALRFLRGLERNNEKPWFEAHREDYERDVRDPMRALIEEMNGLMSHVAPEMHGDPRRAMFRIHRDVRFSRDKSPYKTHAACWFSHRNASRKVGSDANEGSAGFYFQIQPGGRSMVGGGIRKPPRPQLANLRDAIAEDPDTFNRVVKGIQRRFGGLDDSAMLRRMPRGYSDGHPAATWLRYQSFTCGRQLSDADAISARLARNLAADFERMLPLVRWANDVLGFPSGAGPKRV